MNVLPFFSFLVLIYYFFCTNHASLEIVAGLYHNCAYEPGQAGMMCWGRNQYGQLGYEDTNNRGDDAGEMSVHLPIVNLGPNFLVYTTSLGGYHSCAASQEPAVKCWGRGAYYQTGHATNNDSGIATGQMGANLAFVEFLLVFVPLKVAGGVLHSCVLSTDALFVCFGANQYGQCGAGTNDTYIIGPPSNIADVDLGSNFTPIDIAAFHDHVCALSQQQSIKCFGHNYYGQLGYGDTTNRGLTPQSMGDGLLVVGLGSNFTPKAVATGGQHTCALSTLKTVKCFGRNTYGQCGQVTPGGTNDNIGDEVNEMDDNLPVIVFPAGFVPMQMALGFHFTCILSESEQVGCFGRNHYGQLGLGHTTSTTSPTLVDLGTDFIPRKITAGAVHTCAISTVDTVKCWGHNGYGQLGLGHANNTGDQANEMGDDLQIVDGCFGCTAAPTTTDPSTQPTNVPTTDPSTAAPTTAVPTTAAPTTVTPTRTSTLMNSTSSTAYRSYDISIGSHNLTCDNISSIAPLIIATATQMQINVTQMECEHDDGYANVTFLLTVPSDLPLWNNKTLIVISVTQLVLQKYPDVYITVVVVEISDVDSADDDEDDDRTLLSSLTIAHWAGIGAAISCLCFLLAAAMCVGMRRKVSVTVNNTTINAHSYIENHGPHAQIQMTAATAAEERG